MNAELAKVVAHRLPHTGHTVSAHKRRETARYCAQKSLTTQTMSQESFPPVLKNNAQQHLQAEGSILFIIRLFIWGD